MLIESIGDDECRCSPSSQDFDGANEPKAEWEKSYLQDQKEDFISTRRYRLIVATNLAIPCSICA
jgi:hypothetical protein